MVHFTDAGSTLRVVGLSETVTGFVSDSPGAGEIENGANTGFPSTLTFGGDNADHTFSGVIQDGGISNLSLVKVGTGVQILSGVSTYTGTTTVTAGGLIVSGSIVSAVTVNDTATLAGDGGVGAVSVLTGGGLFPGSATTGDLATGNVALAAGSTFDVRVTVPAAGQFDSLTVTGTVDLGGATLVIDPGGPAFTGTDSIVLIANDGNDAVTGTFAGLPEGSTFTASDARKFNVSYHGGTGNDVTLSALRTARPSISRRVHPPPCSARP